MKKKMISTIFVGLMLASIFSLCASVNASDLTVKLEGSVPSRLKAGVNVRCIWLFRGYTKGKTGSNHEVTFCNQEPGIYIIKAATKAGSYSFPQIVVLGEESETVSHIIREN